jgi:putative ABC transport system substrate-binding protein
MSFVVGDNIHKFGKTERRRKMKRVCIVFGMLVIAVLVLSVSPVSMARTVRIGFSQIVEHPALDAVRQGVIDELEEAGYTSGENVIYIVKNAQGEYLTAVSIAQNFALEKLDVIVCISTPSAQATLQQIRDVPIVASAVTDFVEAGLVSSYEAYDDPSGNKNITGVSDMVPVKQEFELIKRLNPYVKTVGIIYNPGEANSVHLNKIAKEITPEMELKVLEAPAVNSSEVASAAQSLKGRADAIWISTDNLVISALPVVAKMAIENGIPLVTADPTTIVQGPLAALGFNYYTHGRITGRIVLRILNGEFPNQIPIQLMTDPRDQLLSINGDTAQAAGITLSNDILNQATDLVYGGYKWIKSE